MKVNIRMDGSPGRQKIFLDAARILKFLIDEDRQLEKIIILQSSKYVIITDDNELYKAVTSIAKYDSFSMTRLKKLLEVVTVNSYYEKFGKQKPVIKQEDIEEIRKKALKGGK